MHTNRYEDHYIDDYSKLINLETTLIIQIPHSKSTVHLNNHDFQFAKLVLFSDKTTFTHNAVMSIHNTHIWPIKIQRPPETHTIR